MKKLSVFLPILLMGCVEVAPNLKLPEPLPCPKPQVQAAPVVSTASCPPIVVPQCPKLDMPPISEQVNITIQGDTVKVDKGGEELIRNYVKAQMLLK
jgi:hypothetical protein